MSGVRLSRHHLRRMLDRNRGRVIFIASEAAVMPSPEMAHCSATKSMHVVDLAQPRGTDQRHSGHRQHRYARVNHDGQRAGLRRRGVPGRSAGRSGGALHRREPLDVLAGAVPEASGDSGCGGFRSQPLGLRNERRRNAGRWRVGAPHHLIDKDPSCRSGDEPQTPRA